MKKTKLPFDVLAFLAAIALTVLVGCATVKTPQSIENKTAAVSFIVTAKVVKKNPNWKPQFTIAYQDLRTLEGATNITALEIFDIVNRLPGDKLADGDIGIYVTGAMLFVQDEIGDLQVTQPEYMVYAVRGLRRGVGKGIGVE